MGQFSIVKMAFFATSNSISKESRKKAAVVLMVVHDWNFLRAEPQIIGISIQLVQHQEKTDKILLLLRMIVNIAQILELIEFKWPHI